jgi:hypothetical protein
MFNGLYALLIILGLAVSALGLRVRARQPAITPTPELQPDQIALTWRREGGVSSSCETLEIQMDGQSSISPCSPEKAPNSKAFQISSGEENQLQSWILALQPFKADFNEPGISKPVLAHLVFQGRGARAASIQDQQAIEKYVEALVVEQNADQ